MEASENTAPFPRIGEARVLHRIDPGRVTRGLSTESNAAGFARLELMVGTIFERLMANPGERRR